MSRTLDAVVVGSGPNGLAAAVTLAREGLRVVVLEGQPQYGGGLVSGADTLPGFVHDRGATVHALALASPVLRSMPLREHGLLLAHPAFPLAHPLDDGPPVLLARSVPETAAGLAEDVDAYRRLLGPLVDHSEDVLQGVLGPARVPSHPIALARFGVPGLLPARLLGRAAFRGERGRALLAGLAAHSVLPLDSPLTGAFGLVLGIAAHSVGWPVAVGGSQSVARALVSVLRSYGGEVVTEHPVRSPADLPPARVVLFDTAPAALERIAGDALDPQYRRRLTRYRYGAGIVKVDWALDGPVPWRDRRVGQAGTVHLGGTLAEIADAEAQVMAGRNPERPYVLAVQATVADPSRAPEGKHTLWAYAHVPYGSTVDVSDRIEAQIERFAPGFRDRVLARRVWLPSQLEATNANLAGGVISGGEQNWRQVFTRPVGVTRVLDPYQVPVRSGLDRRLPGLFLCSSSTPPGGGAHGMSGWWAARSALRREFGVRLSELPASDTAG